MVCATNSSSQNITKLDIMAPHKTEETYLKQEQAQQDQGDLDMTMEDEDDSEEDSSQDEMSHHTSILKSEHHAINEDPAAKQQRPPVSQPLFLNFTSDLSPQKISKKKSKSKKQTAYRVNGVNILNRNELDSKTAIERLQRRRENHNHVERRRRDNINNTIFELSTVVPNAIKPGQKPNKGNILKLSLDYIKELKAENEALRQRLYQHTSAAPSTSASSETASVEQNAMMTMDTSFSTNIQDSNSASNPNLSYPPYQAKTSQPSPSAPSSPQHYGFSNNVASANHTFNMQQAASMPNSPVFTSSNNSSSNSSVIQHHQQHTLPPPPLSLPPPPSLATHSQQQIQHIFSNMSVSSTSPNSSTPNTSSTTSSSSSPMLVATAAKSKSAVPQPNSSYPSFFNSQPPTATTTPLSASTTNSSSSNTTPFHHIPQPPTLYNHNIDHTSNLRPLLPATDKPASITLSSAPFILPSLRMSGYEKIYGNVCRY